MCPQTMSIRQHSSMKLYEFLRGERGRDGDKARIGDILQWSDQKLENDHTYIQWLFPNCRPSQAQPNTPHMNEAERDKIKQDAVAMQNFGMAFSRILSFYGLFKNTGEDIVLDRGRPKTVQLSGKYIHNINLLDEGNHNTLRMSRILTSLRLFGFNNEAEILFNCLHELILLKYIQSAANVEMGLDLRPKSAYSHWYAVVFNATEDQLLNKE